MSRNTSDREEGVPVRARSALFTLFGDVVRPTGGEAWLTVLTECMGVLGHSPEATRTALHRMAAEGWVEPRRVGRYAAYRLTPLGVDRLEEAAARIYRLRAVDWDHRWRLLVSPAIGRDAELGRSLAWMGFGRLTADTWVSPHPHGERLAGLLARHEVAEDAVRFLADATGDDAGIVRRAWDLGELRAAHAAFLDRWRGVRAPGDPAAAFTMRIELVHHWRSFLFLDPGLPVALLPADWLGDEAAACFRDLYGALDAAAWRYYEVLAGAAPGAEGKPLERDRGATIDLDLLQTTRPLPSRSGSDTEETAWETA
jgi:phenylacetic acid degradation operon negative regulatory protein